MEIYILALIVLLIISSYVFSEYLSYLNASYRNKNIPEVLQGIYDKEKYLKSQKYGAANTKLSLFKNSFDTVIILAMLLLGGFSIVNSLTISLSENIIVSTLLFFAILMFASDIISTPFSLYSTFVIEEKFGFNKTTLKTFITDKLKSWLLMAVIGGGILAAIIWFYLQTQDYFWILVWAMLSLFSIFMAMFYSTLIVPLFNKQKPLEDGELRTAINKFADKAGFNVTNIFVIDGSKRSTKANAYFSGFGKKKRIVLFDTLINDMEVDEIVAVLAHEIGHYKKKHIISSMALSILQSGFMLYLFSLFAESKTLSHALGADKLSFALNLIAFSLLYSPISFVLGLLMSKLSRKNEYEADNFAKQYGLAEPLISGLKKLTAKNLSNLTPHPLYVKFYYSHPTLLQRLTALQKDERN
ncbi:MAG: M48 family metallopeptidase [Bacteroidota bacterium]|nr:M48 family metallopeptidase [Bacteroidota bacterium]